MEPVLLAERVGPAPVETADDQPSRSGQQPSLVGIAAGPCLPSVAASFRLVCTTGLALALLWRFPEADEVHLSLHKLLFRKML